MDQNTTLVKISREIYDVCTKFGILTINNSGENIVKIGENK